MLKVTAQQRANAIEARDVFWPTVPPEEVGLNSWFCGTHACFGGWCTRHPAFIAQGLVVGITADFGSRPLVYTGEGADWEDGDVVIFGDPTLFRKRERHPADYIGLLESEKDAKNYGDDFEGTDHEVVTRRLNWLIEHSEVIDA